VSDKVNSWWEGWGVKDGIEIHQIVFRSPELLHLSRLASPAGSDDVHCGVDLSAMDEYRLRYFHELDRNRLVHEQLSEDIRIFELRFASVETDLEQLTKIRHECELECTRSGISSNNQASRNECHALLYWFECSNPSSMSGGDSNGAMAESSGAASLDLSQCKGARVSAYIFSESRHLAEGERLKVQVSLHHGNVIFNQVLNTLFL
jgi:hypothetical protein